MQKHRTQFATEDRLDSTTRATIFLRRNHNTQSSRLAHTSRGKRTTLPSLQKKPAAIRNHRKSIWCGSFRTLRGKNHVQVRRACVQLPYRGKLVRPTPQKSSPAEGGTGLDCSPCSRTEQPRNVRGSPDRLRQRRVSDRVRTSENRAISRFLPAAARAHPRKRAGTPTRGTVVPENRNKDQGHRKRPSTPLEAVTTPSRDHQDAEGTPVSC